VCINIQQLGDLVEQEKEEIARTGEGIMVLNEYCHYLSQNAINSDIQSIQTL